MQILKNDPVVTEPGMPLIEYCGEFTPVPQHGLTIGRAGDLVLDEDNRFLHRVVIRLAELDGLWFLQNVGRHLAVDAADQERRLEVVLGPRASLPLTTPRTTVRVSAGSTRYEFEVLVPIPAGRVPAPTRQPCGDHTLGHLPLTPEQKLLIVALAEPTLRDGRAASLVLPTSAEAAQRLGWTITKFNRKLDNVCAKLSRHGVRGLHGDIANLAFRRRSRLVDYCVRTQLVTVADLITLDEANY